MIIAFAILSCVFAYAWLRPLWHKEVPVKAIVLVALLTSLALAGFVYQKTGSYALQKLYASIQTPLKTQGDAQKRLAVLKTFLADHYHYDVAISAAMLHTEFGEYKQAKLVYQQIRRESGPIAEAVAFEAELAFFTAGQKVSPQMRTLTNEALLLNPNSTRALSLSGMMAFEDQTYQKAIEAWQAVLQQQPSQNTQSFLRQGIARAKAMLAQQHYGGQGALAPQVPASGEGASAASGVKSPVILSVELALSDKTQLPNSVSEQSIIYITAKALQGPPMPLAVKRVRLGDLPVQVSLSDADAMMPKLAISKFEEVAVQARISASGDAIRQSDDVMSNLVVVKPKELTDVVELRF